MNDKESRREAGATKKRHPFRAVLIFLLIALAVFVVVAFAAYRDGSVWRMVIVVFGLELEEEPNLVISSESKDLRFFTKEEIANIQIPVTHSDIVEDLFLKR